MRFTFVSFQSCRLPSFILSFISRLITSSSHFLVPFDPGLLSIPFSFARILFSTALLAFALSLPFSLLRCQFCFVSHVSLLPSLLLFFFPFILLLLLSLFRSVTFSLSPYRLAFPFSFNDFDYFALLTLSPPLVMRSFFSYRLFASVSYLLILC